MTLRNSNNRNIQWKREPWTSRLVRSAASTDGISFWAVQQSLPRDWPRARHPTSHRRPLAQPRGPFTIGDLTRSRDSSTLNVIDNSKKSHYRTASEGFTERLKNAKL